MRLLKVYKIFLVGIVFFNTTIYADNQITICMTGRIVKSLPAYGESFVNAAYLAKDKYKKIEKVNIRTYFYDNLPLEPINTYKNMLKDGCSAIVGFEYLSDLLLIIEYQKNDTIPIFTSYASTRHEEIFPNNIFIFMPDYDYLASKMINFINKRFGEANDSLILTEVNRDEMLRYKSAYTKIFNKNKITYDTYDFLENDARLVQKIMHLTKKKKYKYVFLLAGTIASGKIADKMNNHKIIFIGTENYGSSISQSFFLRIKDKGINSFFIRNIDFLKSNPLLDSFDLATF